MKIVLLGPPGSGKGTQAEKICRHFSIANVSTGKLLRNSVVQETDLGKKVAEYMKSFDLVPDDIMIEFVESCLVCDKNKNGYILDGFPRTLNQAVGLDRFDIIDYVILIDVPDELIVDRLSGRLQCNNCGASYNTKYRAPKIAGVCDVCGTKLVARSDDENDIILKRLKDYHCQIDPLKKFYVEKNILKIVDGTKSVDEISSEIFRILQNI
jgi:adenylate kinase